jgi:hypothetical protein
MGKWSQKRLRGGGPVVAVSTPLLATPDGISLTWTIVGPTPPRALIFFSAGSGGPYILQDDVLWTNQPFPEDTNPGFYVLFGADGSSIPVTGESNEVNIP